MNERILVVDDDEGVREAIKMTLEYDGYKCLFARSGQEGLDRVAADAGRTEVNLMPSLLDAARARATVGEVVDVLEGVFGTYTETVVV